MKIDIKVTQEILDAAHKVAESVSNAIGLSSSRYSFENYLGVSKQVQKLRAVSSTTRMNLRGSRILEIGSGCGMFLCVANKLGLDCYGLSPASGSYAGQFLAAKELLAENEVSLDRIVDAFAEDIPFAPASFDLVVCFDVLEHVRDPLRVIEESVRVLKPGGMLYAYGAAPSYFWEYHYAIPWIPGMPRWLAKRWVRLFRRSPEFLSDLNLISVANLLRKLRSIADVGHTEVFKRQLSDIALSGVRDTNNEWLNDIQCSEVVTPAAFVRSTSWVQRWCQFVMLSWVRAILSVVALVPILELAVRKRK